MKSKTLLLTTFASIYATLSFSQAGTLDSSFNNIKQLPAGTYYLHVEENLTSGTKNKKISNMKFVKD